MAKRVLLTGANGFLGSHILSLLLKSSYSVRAIVRSQSKADQVIKDFPKAGASLDFGIVPDITAPHSFDSVVQSQPPFDAVIHTASPYLYSAVSDNLRDFIEPAVKGTEEILKSIKSHAPGVKRVVLTSSCAAVLDFDAGNNGKVYTEADWNPTTWEQAVEGNMGTGYRGSKKFAEKAGTIVLPLSQDLLCFPRSSMLIDNTFSLGLYRERKTRLRSRSTVSPYDLRPSCT